MENVMENKTIWQKIKWWFNFITSIIMNSIIVILVLIGFLFLAYYIDVTKNVNTGHWQPPLFGAYVIVSPSMEPTIHVQDAILIKRTDDLKIGDICTYYSTNPKYPGKMITHRIVGTNLNEKGEKEFFLSIGEAERRTGILHGNIVKVLKGKRKKAGGRYWHYC